MLFRSEREDSDEELPDLVMENVEYVRIRSSDPLARFQAERAERYDALGVMRLQYFSFEQYGERGEEVNAFGQAAYASVDINSSDVFMDHGVRIEVESEDIIIETIQLEWLDEPRFLSTGKDQDVSIFRENGTGFTGIELGVDARRRTWEFAGAVGGVFIHDGDGDEEDETEDYLEEDTANIEVIELLETEDDPV